MSLRGLFAEPKLHSRLQETEVQGQQMDLLQGKLQYTATVAHVN